MFMCRTMNKFSYDGEPWQIGLLTAPLQLRCVCACGASCLLPPASLMPCWPDGQHFLVKRPLLCAGSNFVQGLSEYDEQDSSEEQHMLATDRAQGGGFLEFV